MAARRMAWRAPGPRHPPSNSTPAAGPRALIMGLDPCSCCGRSPLASPPLFGSGISPHGFPSLPCAPSDADISSGWSMEEQQHAAITDVLPFVFACGSIEQRDKTSLRASSLALRAAVDAQVSLLIIDTHACMHVTSRTPHTLTSTYSHAHPLLSAIRTCIKQQTACSLIHYRSSASSPRCTS